MNVFISYNHKDQAIAIKIKDHLKTAGIETLMDVDDMPAGKSIEQFIYESLQKSQSTLLIISTYSLMSGWVTMETVAGKLDELLSRRYFIPCYVDAAFLDREFTSRALDRIESELQEIDTLIQKAVEKGRGIEDLQNERTRYMGLKINLPQIVGDLKESGCVDLTPSQFDIGIGKIIKDLNDRTSHPIDNKLVETAPRVTMGSIREMIVNTMDDFTQSRINDITRRLSMQRELLDKYEQNLLLEIDPRRQMYCEIEIKKLKTNIQDSIKEINDV